MLRILIVDSRPERAELLRETLVAAGYQVVAHRSDALGLASDVTRHQADVVIIDTDSPDRDTLEHVCMVSRDARRPVVMFSHDGSSEKIREAIQAGISAYVVGSIEGRRVQSIIDVAIARFKQYEILLDELADARASLEDRKLIERAKGVLMKQRGCGEDEAYHLLRKQAMARNAKLRDVAREVVSVADLFKS